MVMESMFFQMAANLKGSFGMIGKFQEHSPTRTVTNTWANSIRKKKMAKESITTPLGISMMENGRLAKSMAKA